MKKGRERSNAVPVNTIVLRAERENKGWKQEDLANSTGLPVSTISRIERSGKAYLSTLRKIAEGLGVEIEKLSLRTAGNLPNDKKGADYTYFLDMRKLLAWNEKEVKAQWFRKSGPIAADIQAGFTYPCSKMLKALCQLIHINRLSILEGDAGSGKSVLVRLLAYDLITQQPQARVYFCSIKDHIQDLNYTVLRGEVERLTGFIIIEDSHLAARDIYQLLRDLSGEEKRTILLTTRASTQGDNLNGRGGMLGNSLGLAPRLQITPDADQISHIIDKFSSVNDIPLNSKDRLSIKKECKNNLWLLSYALMGCHDNRGEGNPLKWVAAGIKHDFEEIESAGCNPEVLLALSPLYMHEVPTADEFLIHELGIKPEDIKKLLKRREIFKVVEKHRVYYRLPHATLAKVYWDFRDDTIAAFLTRLKQKELREDSIDYIYHYATYRNRHNSGLPNGLTAILRMDYPAKTLLLQRLDVDRKTINTIMSDTNVESFYEWLQAYGFYIAQKPTSNIIVELMKPILTEEQNTQLDVVYHQLVKQMSLLLTTSENREKLKRSISRISRNNIDPNDICQLLSFLSYIDRSLMDEFWISKGRELLSMQILSLILSLFPLKFLFCSQGKPYFTPHLFSCQSPDLMLFEARVFDDSRVPDGNVFLLPIGPTPSTGKPSSHFASV
jgi:transcriptional regulator with XRE-family HTH domain/energy-coupling factor transporter ATP-binding protein EcfA2